MMNIAGTDSATAAADESAAPAVRAERLTVVRGARPVLRRLDFAVPRGRITGLLGPSGCGKSTLMRAVVGTQARVSGSLDVLGRPAGSADLRSRIGYVTQAPSVYQDLTVRQNLEYFAAVLEPVRRAAARRREQVTRAIADVDLTSHAGSLAANLSGGQRGRVSLAVALLGAPELLVLDEPTVGLDPVLRRDLWKLFRSLATERGATILVSSHVMDEAERCDRLLLMRDGEILAEDSPAALRENTGSATVEEAFLRLVDEAAARSAAGDDRVAGEEPGAGNGPGIGDDLTESGTDGPGGTDTPGGTDGAGGTDTPGGTDGAGDATGAGDNPVRTRR